MPSFSIYCRVQTMLIIASPRGQILYFTLVLQNKSLLTLTVEIKLQNIWTWALTIGLLQKGNSDSESVFVSESQQVPKPFMRLPVASFVLPRSLYLGKSDRTFYYFSKTYASEKNTSTFPKPLQDGRYRKKKN